MESTGGVVLICPCARLDKERNSTSTSKPLPKSLPNPNLGSWAALFFLFTVKSRAYTPYIIERFQNTCIILYFWSLKQLQGCFTRINIFTPIQAISLQDCPSNPKLTYSPAYTLHYYFGLLTMELIAKCFDERPIMTDKRLVPPNKNSVRIQMKCIGT